MALVPKLINRPCIFLRIQNCKTLGPLLGNISTSCTVRLYRDNYRRPGVPPDNTPPWKKINFDFKKGVEGVKKHFGLLKQEIIDHVTGPDGRPLEEYILAQTKVVWEFRSPDDLDQWIVSSDQEAGGKSEAYLKIGKNNQTAMLYGILNTNVPRDGETRYSGYCSMRSKPPQCQRCRTLLLKRTMSCFATFKKTVLQPPTLDSSDDLSSFPKTVLFVDYCKSILSFILAMLIVLASLELISYPVQLA